jgi:hypothetical protein
VLTYTLSADPKMQLEKNEQGFIYLFKVWFTAATVFPIGYSFYYINFDPHPDGMIWLWCMITIPGSWALSLPCWFVCYSCLTLIQQHLEKIYIQKICLCFASLFIIAVVYVCFFGFTNNITYPIVLVFDYWILLAASFWLYRLKPLQQS